MSSTQRNSREIDTKPSEEHDAQTSLGSPTGDTKADDDVKQGTADADEDIEYPHGLKLFLLLMTTYICSFLGSLVSYLC
jgi:hypothetical protein